MKLSFALDGVTVNEKGTLATCDRLHAFSIVNALLFQLACTDATQNAVASTEELEEVDTERGERLPPRP
jgi:hypothetical protein